MEERLMVIAAHLGDVVWRCGGVIAKYCKAGKPVKVVVLSYGLRGESASLWRGRPGQTMENARAVREAEGRKMMQTLGVSDFEFWDLKDYPMEITTELTERLAAAVRAFNPKIVLTHDRNRDVFNQDHGLASELAWRACIVAGADGFDGEGRPPVLVSQMYGFEPHMPDLSDFAPDVYIDITDVMDVKQAAMNCNETQKGLIGNYVAKAEMRANHFRRLGGHADCKYAECFSSYYPSFRQWF